MRNHLQTQHDCTRLWPNLRWLHSEQIQLALDESHEDSRRLSLQKPHHWEPLTEPELLTYHRQLFMWRIIRVKTALSPLLSN